MRNLLMKVNLKTFNQFIVESNDGGDCYEAAGRLILFGDDELNSYGELYLIHGMVDGQGPLKGIRYDHAWCEDDHLIYDFSNGRRLIFPKQLYYSIGNIKESENFKYSKEEARKFILDTGTWGPWERVFERIKPSIGLELINEESSLYQRLISNGIDFALSVFDTPSIGSGNTIIKNIVIDGTRLRLLDNGKIVTLFDENKNMLARLFYDNYDGRIEIGFINSFRPGEGYSKILMLYLSSKYGYHNIDRDILTSYGEQMRHELDKFFEE